MVVESFISLLVLSFFIFQYGYWYLFCQQHRDYSKESAKYHLSSQSLLSDFEESESLANNKYLDQVLQIRGRVTLIEMNSDSLSQIELDRSILCRFDSSLDIMLGDDVVLKGRCVGYDNLFKQVDITRSIIVDIE